MVYELITSSVGKLLGPEEILEGGGLLFVDPTFWSSYAFY